MVFTSLDVGIGRFCSCFMIKYFFVPCSFVWCIPCTYVFDKRCV